MTVSKVRAIFLDGANFVQWWRSIGEGLLPNNLPCVFLWIPVDMSKLVLRWISKVEQSLLEFFLRACIMQSAHDVQVFISIEKWWTYIPWQISNNISSGVAEKKRGHPSSLVTHFTQVEGWGGPSCSGACCTCQVFFSSDKYSLLTVFVFLQEAKQKPPHQLAWLWRGRRACSLCFTVTLL